MKIKCIATGSKGNTYALISNTGEILLLDLGASEKEIKKALDFNISGIVGACVTHKHLDHYKSAKAFERLGIDIFKAHEDSHFQTSCMTFGEFKISAFALDDLNCEHWQHTNTDGSECQNYGFYINHKELDGAFIYATDTKFIKWNFKKQKPGYILLGVDYQDDLIDTDNGKYNHVLTGHMSIDTACDFISANKTDSLKTVLIGHISESSADSDYFTNKVKEVVNCPIYVCKKGMEVDLDLPF